MNQQLTVANPYVYAFILSARDWMRADQYVTARTFANPPTPPEPVWGRVPPEGQHIVALNGPIRSEGSSYVLPVWTWQRSFEVRIPAGYLAGYVPIFVHGQVA